MQAFTCQACQQLIFFENVQWLRCGRTLGYLSEAAVLSALEPLEGDLWRALDPEAGSRSYRMCRNYRQENVCNWMVPAEESEALCLACRFNQTLPDLRPTGRTPSRR